MTPKHNRLVRVLEEAIKDPGGIDIACDSELFAKRLRMVLYKVRQRMRAKGHPDQEDIDQLDFTIVAGEAGKFSLRLHFPSLRFDELVITKVETGENISGKFNVSDEVVSIVDPEPETKQ